VGWSFWSWGVILVGFSFGVWGWSCGFHVGFLFLVLALGSFLGEFVFCVGFWVFGFCVWEVLLFFKFMCFYWVVGVGSVVGFLFSFLLGVGF